MRNFRFAILTGCVALSMLMSGAALLSVTPMVTAAPAEQGSTPRTVTMIEPARVTTGTTYLSLIHI